MQVCAPVGLELNQQPFSRFCPIQTNPARALCLFETLGWIPTEADAKAFLGCKTIQEIMDRLLLDTSPVRHLFLTGTSEGLGNLREFYVALLLEAQWTPRPGYDVRKIFEIRSGLKIGRVEVRGARPKTKGARWDIRITDSNGDLASDVVVIVCMKESYNPCFADIFAVPRQALQDVVVKTRVRRESEEVRPKDPRIRILICKDRIDNYRNSLNKWWSYWVPDHSELKSVVTSYIEGNFKPFPKQLSFENISR